MSEYNDCLRDGKIAFGNDFKTRAEINKLFGLKAGAGTMQGGASLVPTGREAIIWWPNNPSDNNEWLNVKEGFGPVADSRGYKEVLLISEQNRDAVANLSHLNEVLETPRSQMRYVFWHEERCGVRWYKFYGLFKFMRERSQRDGKCWFERADSTISLRSRHVATLTSKIRKSDYEY